MICQKCEKPYKIGAVVSMPPHDKPLDKYCLDCAIGEVEERSRKKITKVVVISNKKEKK